MWKVELTSLALVVPLLMGCPPSSKKRVGQFTCSDLTTTYFRHSPELQQAEFGRFDLEKQYAVLICGNQVIHPPAMYLGRVFALGGQRSAEFLKQKLAEAPDDATVRDIVFVFTQMRRQGTYDVAHDADLMRSVSARVNQMTDPEWKRITSKMVDEIRG